MKRLKVNLLWTCFLSFMLFFTANVSAQEYSDFQQQQEEQDEVVARAVTFPVTVKVLNGITYNLELGHGDLISQVKWFIYYRSGIPVESQRLFCNGMQLTEDNKNVSDYGITKNSVIHLIIRGVL